MLQQRLLVRVVLVLILSASCGAGQTENLPTTILAATPSTETLPVGSSGTPVEASGTTHSTSPAARTQITEMPPAEQIEDLGEAEALFSEMVANVPFGSDVKIGGAAEEGVLHLYAVDTEGTHEFLAVLEAAVSPELLLVEWVECLRKC